jgi:trimeric autotransporter adhesin
MIIGLSLFSYSSVVRIARTFSSLFYSRAGSARRRLLALVVAALCFVPASGMATTFTVTNTYDSGTGSLRQALASAQNWDTIDLSSLTGTINLTSGGLTINNCLTIVGPGANVLTVSGNNAYTVFTVNFGLLTISGLTIANGNGSQAGGIYNIGGTMTVSNSTFSGNSAPGAYGGGIYNLGTLTVSNSTFSGNSATSGGGIANYGWVAVSNSTFSGNSATALGGAIFSLGNYSGMAVSNSTFSGNSATDYGGAIFSGYGGTVTVSNSTFSGNSAIYWGGGIYNENATLTLSNSTISGNSASRYGGGIYNTGGTVTTNNSIFSGNSAPSGFGGGIYNTGGTANASYNVFWNNLANGTEDDCNGCNSNTNARFVPATTASPLAPLGNYGGPTQTMLPLPGSAAICAASAALAVDVQNHPLTSDQRGFALNPACVDAGAVQTNYLTVNTTKDWDDGSCTSTTCSLRDALNAANTAGYGDIDFASGLTGTINLSTGTNTPLPAITGQVNLFGPGANVLTVYGGNPPSVGPILTVDSGAQALISGLTIANGNSSSGGGILNSGTLAVSNSTFSGNSAIAGGGINNNGNGNGTLTVSNSTFSGNSATNGGGINNNGNGVLTVSNSTFSVNSATNGGGINNNGNGNGTLTVSNSTFSGNSATTGGGIYNLPIDTANASYNVFWNNIASGVEDDCNECSSNSNAINLDPKLATLGNYGGPTQTMLPLPGSAAICAGSTALIPSGLTTDQRGFARITSYSGTACVDAGAVQTNYQSVQFTNVPAAGNYIGYTNQAISPAPVVSVTENGQNIGGVPVTLNFSGTGNASGLGPVTTVGGTGATFSSLSVNTVGSGDTLSVSLPITASGNAVQPNLLTASASLDINAAAPTTTTASNITVTYGAANAPLSATVTSSAESVNLGTVTFTVLQGSTVIGTSVTSSTVSSNGLASVTYVLPAGTAAGNYTIDAVYNGSGAFLASSDNTHTLTISKATPVFSNLSSPTIAYGQTLTLGGNISAGSLVPYQYTIVDFVTIKITGTGIACVAAIASSGQFSCTMPSLPAAQTTPYGLDYLFGSDPNFNSVENSTSATLTVNKANTTTTVAVTDASISQSWSGTEVTGARAFATSTVQSSVSGGPAPTGTVTYSFYANGNCSGQGVQSTTVTLNSGVVPNSTTIGPLGGGSYSYQASYSGDGNYLGSSSSCSSFSVNKSTGINAVNSSTNPSVFGQSVTFTPTFASVSGFTPTGTVSFSVGSNSSGPISLSGGTASYTPNTLSAGSYTVTASYSGDSNYLPGQGSLTGNPQVVAKANQSPPLVITGPVSVTYGVGAPATTTGGSGTGAVTFSATGGGCTMSGGSLAGMTTVSVNDATLPCYLTATKAGDRNYNPTTSAPSPGYQVNLSKATQTLSFNAGTVPGNAVYNATFTPAATATSGLSATAITVSGGCSISGGVVTMTSGTTACVVYATQTGNNNYQAATQLSATVGATLATQTLGFNAGTVPGNAVYNATFTPKATSTSGLPATITASGGCSISGGTVTMTSGTTACAVKAAQAGSSNYSAATEAVQSVTAQKASVTSDTMQTSAASVLLNNNVTLTAKVTSTSGTPTGSVNFIDGTTSLGSGTLDNTGTATLTLSTLAAGSHSLTANYAGDSNFNGITSSALSETVQDFQLAINGGSGGGSGTVLSTTVLPGGVATYQIQLTPTNGTTFPAAITLTLSGLPAGATYTITPSSIAAGSAAQTVTVQVQTPKPVTGLRVPGTQSPIFALAMLLPMFGMVRLRRAVTGRGRRVALVLCLLLAIAILGMSACGGGGSGFMNQAPQTYTMQLNATATGGTLQHSTTLSLTIQ